MLRSKYSRATRANRGARPGSWAFPERRLDKAMRSSPVWEVPYVAFDYPADPAVRWRRWLLRISQRLLWRRWNEPNDRRANRPGGLAGDGWRNDTVRVLQFRGVRAVEHDLRLQTAGH